MGGLATISKMVPVVEQPPHKGSTNMQKRPRTKAAKKRLIRIKDERRTKKTRSRVMPNRNG